MQSRKKQKFYKVTIINENMALIERVDNTVKWNSPFSVDGRLINPGLLIEKTLKAYAICFGIVGFVAGTYILGKEAYNMIEEKVRYDIALESVHSVQNMALPKEYGAIKR